MAKLNLTGRHKETPLCYPINFSVCLATNKQMIGKAILFPFQVKLKKKKEVL